MTTNLQCIHLLVQRWQYNILKPRLHLPHNSKTRGYLLGKTQNGGPLQTDLSEKDKYPYHPICHTTLLQLMYPSNQPTDPASSSDCSLPLSTSLPSAFHRRYLSIRSVRQEFFLAFFMNLCFKSSFAVGRCVCVCVCARVCVCVYVCE